MKKTKKMIALLLSLTLMLSIFSVSMISANALTVKTNDEYRYQIINDKYVEILKYINKELVDEVVIPETIDGYPVTIIGDYAFKSNELGSVVIPDTVTHLGNSAFEDCESLKKANIPDSVVSIGGSAFAHTMLESVTLPSGLRNMGADVFYDCYKLKKAVISEGITEIPTETFSWCTALSKVVLPDGLETISYRAFSYCTKLKNIEIPDTVNDIWNNAFTSSGLKKIKLSKNTNLNEKSVGFKYKKVNGKTKTKALKNFTIVGSGTSQITYANKNGFKMVIKLDTTKTNIATAYTKQKFNLKLSGSQSVKKWKSSNKKIATVNQNGKVKTLKKGVTTITAKVNSKTTVKCKVKVRS